MKVKPGERWHELIKTEPPSMTASDGAAVLPEDISRVSRYAESLYENELKVHQVWPLAKILFCWLFVKIIWYFSDICRSEGKFFHYCCIHGKVKVVRNQVYCRNKVVFGVLRVLSTLVVGISVKKAPIILLK